MQAKQGDLNMAQEDRYSRQLATLGKHSISKFVNQKVFVSGCRGLGAECLKNLILLGPGVVTIHDDLPVQLADLSANFYLAEHHLSKPRAKCMLPQLKVLNEFVDVRLFEGEISGSVLK